MGATGMWNIDMSRAARESLPDYARLTYYEIWFEALLKLLAARALVSDDEVARRPRAARGRELPRKLHAAQRADACWPRARAPNGCATKARFKVGERVRMIAGPTRTTRGCRVMRAASAA